MEIKHRYMIISVVMQVFILCLATNIYAYDTAPRISDREIVESLTELKQGQKAINKRIDDLIVNFNKRFEDMNNNFNKRFEAMDKRFEDMNNNFNKRFEAMDKRFEDMNNNFNKRFEEMNTSFNKRFEAMDKRFEDMHDTMLILYTSTMALLAALIGYLIWDRNTAQKPMKRKIERLEGDISAVEIELDQHLDIRNPSGPVMPRLIKALRELAQTDEKLANVLRSFSLL